MPGGSAGAEQPAELGRGRRPSRPGLAQRLAGRFQQALRLGALDGLDLVTATRLDEPGAEPMRWREIEVEAVEGAKAEGLLEAAGQALREAGARRSAAASKLSRLLGTG